MEGKTGSEVLEVIRYALAGWLMAHGEAGEEVLMLGEEALGGLVAMLDRMKPEVDDEAE